MAPPGKFYSVDERDERSLAEHQLCGAQEWRSESIRTKPGAWLEIARAEGLSRGWGWLEFVVWWQGAPLLDWRLVAYAPNGHRVLAPRGRAGTAVASPIRCDLSNEWILGLEVRAPAVGAAPVVQVAYWRGPFPLDSSPCEQECCMGCNVPANPDALLYENHAGNDQESDVDLLAGNLGPGNCPQIQDRRVGPTPPLYRSGAWTGETAPADPVDRPGGGLRVYGENAAADPMDATHASVATYGKAGAIIDDYASPPIRRVALEVATGLELRDATARLNVTLPPSGNGSLRSLALQPADPLDLARPIVAAGAGSPEGVRFGNKGDLWLRDDGGVGTSAYLKTTNGVNTGWAPLGAPAPAPTPLTQIVWRPGLPSAGDAVASWAEVMGRLAAIAGLLEVVVDVNFAPCQIPIPSAPGPWDLEGRLSFVALDARAATPVYAAVDILDGAQILNLRGATGVAVRGHGTAIAPLKFDSYTAPDLQVCTLQDGAAFENLGTVPMLILGGGDNAAWHLRRAALRKVGPGVELVSVAAGSPPGVIKVVCDDACSLVDEWVTGLGTALEDLSAETPTPVLTAFIAGGGTLILSYDAKASQIGNDSSVPGATVLGALNDLWVTKADQPDPELSPAWWHVYNPVRYTVGPTGTYPDLATAVADVNVLDGDILALQAYTDALPIGGITTAKELTIEGVSPTATILDGTAVGAGAVALTCTGAKFTLRNLTIDNPNTSGAGTEAALKLDNLAGEFFLEHVGVLHGEFGVILHCHRARLVDVQWQYDGPAANNHRSLALYGLAALGGAPGLVEVEDCGWTSTSTSNRMTCVFLTEGMGDSWDGALYLRRCSQYGVPLRHFFLQEAWTGAAGALSIYLDTVDIGNDGGANLAAYCNIDNDADLWGRLDLRRVTTPNNSGRGLISYDGTGPLTTPGAPPTYLLDNVLAAPTISAPGYLAAQAPDVGMVSYNGAVFPAHP